MSDKSLFNQSGFTLIELLITLAIFAGALTAASNIFVYTQRAASRTESAQSTQTDARFVLEVMSQEIRRSNIDYVVYGGAVGGNPQDTLALVSADGSRIQFRRVADGSRGLIQISQDGGTNWTDLTPIDISISGLAFYIAPATDPYAQNPAVNRQVLVTIAISALSLKPGSQPTFIQTTVSPRLYPR